MSAVLGFFTALPGLVITHPWQAAGLTVSLIVVAAVVSRWGNPR